MGWFDPIGWAGDAVDTGMGILGDGADAVGEGFKDYANVGKNKFQPTPYDVQGADWGRDPNAAQDYYNLGKTGLGASNADASWASNMARKNGPMAWEDQDLSNREATTSGYHQQGALNLALNGALGNQPSEAAYQLQAGLDKAVGQQTALQGSARGAAGIANAGANAGGNIANLQQNAFTDAGRLRAQEIAMYSNMYGNLSNQVAQQDMNRLAEGNRMAQFNAQNTTGRQLGFLNGSYQGQQVGQGWYGQMGRGYDQNLSSDQTTEQNRLNAYNASLGLGASIAQSNADAAGAMRDRFTGAGVQATETAGKGLLSTKGAPS